MYLLALALGTLLPLPMPCDLSEHRAWEASCTEAIEYSQALTSAEKKAGLYGVSSDTDLASDFSAACARAERTYRSPHGYSTGPHPVCTQVQHVEWLHGCISDARGLRPGKTRVAVLRKFLDHGGFHELGTNVVNHSDCWYLHVELHFSLLDNQEEHDDDPLLSVSRPFFDLLAFD